MSSYTRGLTQANSFSNQLLDTNGVVAVAWGNAWNYANNVNWSLAQGGTDTATMGWSYVWSDGGYFGFGQGAPNPWTWDTTSTTGIKWPAAPGLGTQTNRYDWASWAYDYDLASYYLARSYSTNASEGVAQPTYPWVHVAVSSLQTSAGVTSTPNYRSPWTNALTETAQAHVELLTGGEPGASNVMFYSLWVYVGDSSGSGVSPGDLVVAGQTADASGRVVLALPANASQDITPALPESYTNYYFWVGGPYAWTYAVVYVAPDDWSPSVSSNVTFTAQMNDIGPVPPVIEWRVNGVVDTNSTSTTLTRAFTNAGPYTASARCVNPGADTNAPEATVTAVFRGTINLSASATDVPLGATVGFTAVLTPACATNGLDWTAPNMLLPLVPGVEQAVPQNRIGGLTESFRFSYSGEQTVRVSYGESYVSRAIRVYEVTDLTAAESQVGVGSNATFFATVVGGTNVPPIEWFTNGVMVTNAIGTNLTFAVSDTGQWAVKAKLGDSERESAITGVFAGTINLMASAEHVALGSNVTFTAALTPNVTPVSITWSGDVPTQTGGLSQAFAFAEAGERVVTFTGDLSSASKTTMVYAVTGVTASESLVAVGSLVTFTAALYPPGGNPPPLTWKLGNTILANTGSLLTCALTNVGTNTVSAGYGTNTQDVAVIAVGVKRIEYIDPDAPAGWIAAPSPLFVYQGDTVQFRAIPDPEDAAWPAGKPEWEIGASTAGSGTEKTRVFPTLSASATDATLVTARCGTSSNSAFVVVFKTELTFAPDDNFEGRSLSQFGLGEVINITNTITPADLSFNQLGLEWRTNFPYPATLSTSSGQSPTLFAGGSGTGVVGAAAAAPASATTGGSGGNAGALSAGSSAAAQPGVVAVLQAFIEARYEVGVGRRNRSALLDNKGFFYIPPASAEYVVLSGPLFHHGKNIWLGPTPVHITNSLTALQGLDIWVKPATVSWANIVIREGFATMYKTGIAATNGTQESFTHSPGPDLPLSKGIPSQGCKVTNYCDAAGPWSPPPSTQQPPFMMDGGDYGAIPIEYKVNCPSTSIWAYVPFDIAYRNYQFDTNGNMKCEKKGKKWDVNYAAPTVSHSP